MSLLAPERSPRGARHSFASEPSSRRIALCANLAADLYRSTDRNAVLEKRLHDVRYFAREEMAGCLGTHDGCRYLTFRGTATGFRTLGNLDATLAPFLGLKAHRGFVRAYEAVRSLMLKELTRDLDHPFPKPLVIAGHSLGGAVATLAAWELRHRLPIELVCTFGQPRVFDAKSAPLYDAAFGKRHLRFVHNNDLVPHLPPGRLRILFRLLHRGAMLWARGPLRRLIANRFAPLFETAHRLPGHFAHIGRLRYLDANGIDQHDASRWYRFYDALRGAWRDRSKPGLDAVTDHAMLTYRNHLANRAVGSVRPASLFDPRPVGPLVEE